MTLADGGGDGEDDWLRWRLQLGYIAVFRDWCVQPSPEPSAPAGTEAGLELAVTQASSERHEAHKEAVQGGGEEGSGPLFGSLRPYRSHVTVPGEASSACIHCGKVPRRKAQAASWRHAACEGPVPVESMTLRVRASLSFAARAGLGATLPPGAAARLAAVVGSVFDPTRPAC